MSLCRLPAVAALAINRGARPFNAHAFALAALAASSIPSAAVGGDADFYLSSTNTNQVMRFNEITGAYLGVVANVPGPTASQIGFDGDLFVPASTAGAIYRYDGFTGRYKGVFITPGAGGLTTPVAPGFGPDNLVYVDDAATNKVLRYDRNGKFIDIFCDGVTSPLSAPYMQTFDDTSMYIASGNTNSILRYDLKTKAYLGAFVPPGSGGLVRPIGLEFGPDGNLYASSAGTNAILRYDGKTGKFIDVFVPPGAGGLDFPRAVRFGGPNSDLYVASSNNNRVVQFDRMTGKLIRVVADGAAEGISGSRGLEFTPRPKLLVYSHVKGNREQRELPSGFRHIYIEHHINDYSDPHPNVALTSIVSSDPRVDMSKAVKHAHFGQPDFEFDLDFHNSTGTDQLYKITYVGKNKHGLSKIATTTVKVPRQ